MEGVWEAVHQTSFLFGATAVTCSIAGPKETAIPNAALLLRTLSEQDCSQYIISDERHLAMGCLVALIHCTKDATNLMLFNRDSPRGSGRLS